MFYERLGKLHNTDELRKTGVVTRPSNPNRVRLECNRATSARSYGLVEPPYGPIAGLAASGPEYEVDTREGQGTRVQDSTRMGPKVIDPGAEVRERFHMGSGNDAAGSLMPLPGTGVARASRTQNPNARIANGS